jgi:hypothetical protein
LRKVWLTRPSMPHRCALAAIPSHVGRVAPTTEGVGKHGLHARGDGQAAAFEHGHRPAGLVVSALAAVPVFVDDSRSSATPGGRRAANRHPRWPHRDRLHPSRSPGIPRCGSPLRASSATSRPSTPRSFTRVKVSSSSSSAMAIRAGDAGANAAVSRARSRLAAPW